MTSHRLTNSRIYQTHKNMLARCYYKKDKSYRYYGMKGIRVCEEWRTSFENFYDWAIKNGYDDTLTIERTNPFKDYCPQNCTFIPPEEQNKNKKYTRLNGMDKEQKDIIKLLIETRKKLNLTQRQFANILEISQSNISLMEKGDRKVPGILLLKILRLDPKFKL